MSVVKQPRLDASAEMVGADPLVCGRPPGRPFAHRHDPSLEERVQGTRADQGVCPTISGKMQAASLRYKADQCRI